MAAVARAHTQKRKIRLIKAIGNGMGELLEKQLVEKANMALVLMVEEGQRKLSLWGKTRKGDQEG